MFLICFQRYSLWVRWTIAPKPSTWFRFEKYLKEVYHQWRAPENGSSRNSSAASCLKEARGAREDWWKDVCEPHGIYMGAASLQKRFQLLLRYPGREVWVCRERGTFRARYQLWGMEQGAVKDRAIMGCWTGTHTGKNALTHSQPLVSSAPYR